MSLESCILTPSFGIDGYFHFFALGTVLIHVYSNENIFIRCLCEHRNSFVSRNRRSMRKDEWLIQE